MLKQIWGAIIAAAYIMGEAIAIAEEYHCQDPFYLHPF